MECSLPMDGRRVSLTQLSKDSFRECQASLTLTDLLIIIFSGISVSVVAIMTSFFLASTVHCFQRWSKGTKGDEEESEEWGVCGRGLLRFLVPGNSDGCEVFTAGGRCARLSHHFRPVDHPGLFDGRVLPSHSCIFFFCTQTSQLRLQRTFHRNELQLQSTRILFLCFLGGLFSAHSSSSWLLTLYYGPTDRKRGATYFWRKRKCVQLLLPCCHLSLLCSRDVCLFFYHGWAKMSDLHPKSKKKNTK